MHPGKINGAHQKLVDGSAPRFRRGVLKQIRRRPTRIGNAVDEDLPAGLSTWQRNSGQLPTVEVKDGDGNGSGCQVDVLSRPDGQISGTVVDAHGNGLRGFVTIKPADPIEAEAAMQRGGLPGDDTEDGSFSLPQPPPGKYRLIFYAKIRNALSLLARKE